MTERDWADAHLVNAALDIHADEPAFGYRFIADELPGKGLAAGENRGPAPVPGSRHLVCVLQETGPEPEAAAAGSR